MEPIQVKNLFNLKNPPYSSHSDLVIFNSLEEGSNFIPYRKADGRYAVVDVTNPKDERIVPVMSRTQFGINPSGTLVVTSMEALKMLVLYDLKTKKKVNTCVLDTTVDTYYRWISDEKVVIVTSKTVYHWCTTEGPVKMFDRHPQTCGTRTNAYHTDETGNWHVLVQEGKHEHEMRNRKRRIEVHSIMHQRSRIISGFTACLMNFTVDLSSSKTSSELFTGTVLCYVTMEDQATDVVSAISLDPEFMLTMLWSSALQYHRFPSLETDGCAGLTGSDGHRVVFHLSMAGVLSLFDLGSGGLFYQSMRLFGFDGDGTLRFYGPPWRVSNQCPSGISENETRVFTINTKGDVVEISFIDGFLDKYLINTQDTSASISSLSSSEGEDNVASCGEMESIPSAQSETKKKKKKKKKKNKKKNKKVDCFEPETAFHSIASAQEIDSLDEGNCLVSPPKELEEANLVSSNSIPSLETEIASSICSEQEPALCISASIKGKDFLAKENSLVMDRNNELEAANSSYSNSTPFLETCVTSSLSTTLDTDDLKMRSLTIKDLDTNNLSRAEDSDNTYAGTTAPSNLDEQDQGFHSSTPDGHLTSPLPSEPVPPLPPPEDESKLCIICCEADFNTALVPCGHMWFCFECAKDIRAKGQSCPACRAEVVNVLRVYTPV